MRLAFAALMVAVAAATVSAEPRVELQLEPREATVGDPLALTLKVWLPDDIEVPPDFPRGSSLGDLTVIDGQWSASQAVDDETLWSWQGIVAAYRPGDIELPPIAVDVERDGAAAIALRTEPLQVVIRSVLEADDDGEIADLKPPASLPPDYRLVRLAALIAGLALIGFALLWWLWRRFAGRLSAAPAPADPFHRMPPHEWAERELERLVAERLVEAGKLELYFEKLADIVKRYLTGRFRVELMERTTDEVPGRLRDAGVDDDAIDATRTVLQRCDAAKFAQARPLSGECRDILDDARGIVERTKPRETEAA